MAKCQYSRLPARGLQGGAGGTYEDDLEEHLLVHLHKLLIPLLYFCRFLASVRLVIVSGGGVVAVVLAPLDDLAENGLGNVGLERGVSIQRNGVYARDVSRPLVTHNRDCLIQGRIAKILQHVLDEQRTLSDLAVCAVLVSYSKHQGEGTKGCWAKGQLTDFDDRVVVRLQANLRGGLGRHFVRYDLEVGERWLG